MVILLVIAAVFLIGVLCTTALHFRSHRARLRDLETIVHVNGIRGKSTVTRLIHGALHESGRTTVAKTTGTYACVLAPDKSEHPIMRRYAPNILEQFSIFGKWINKSVNAMVVECMAVRPEYQKFCQDKIVRADIVVITNVRIDHTEEMGETLEEIAKSLCSTMPRGGVVVTGEHNPDVLEVMRAECEMANTRRVVADTDQVSDEHVGSYRYLQFKENVAVGLEICKLLGIDTDTALRGMLAAEPDPGMVTVDTIPIDGKRVHWVPAFAVNDKESTISVLDEVDNMLPEGCPKIGLLNNRSDRGARAELFAEIVCEDVDHHFEKLALLGDLERPVAEKIVGNGWEDEDVPRLGAATNLSCSIPSFTPFPATTLRSSAWSISTPRRPRCSSSTSRMRRRCRSRAPVANPRAPTSSSSRPSSTASSSPNTSTSSPSTASTCTTRTTWRRSASPRPPRRPSSSSSRQRSRCSPGGRR